jgi:hypothetical protein
MPVSAVLGADLPTLSLRLRRRATAMTTRIGRPRGAPHHHSATPRTRSVPNHRRRAEGVACSCPCSVELPGEAA